MNLLAGLRSVVFLSVTGVCTLLGSDLNFRDLARPAIRSYSQRDGLPHHTVQQINQDSKGRLWIATQGGAAFFTGRRWLPFPLPPEAGTTYVRTILEDHQGAIWLGTQDDGAWQWQGGTWMARNESMGLPDPRINHLLDWTQPDGSHSVWAATAQGAAFWMDNRWVPSSEGLDNLWIWKLVSTLDAQQKPVLWACTKGGLARWTGSRWTLEPAFKGLEVNDLLEVPDESGATVWVSCFGKGLGRWKNGQVAFAGKSAGLPLEFPVCLEKTRTLEGKWVLWVGTYNDGLAYLQDGEWVLLTTNQGLRSQGVYTLHADPAGKPTLWIGMQGGGIASLTMDGWLSLQPRSSGFPGGGTTCFAETQEPEGSRIWFGTQRGLLWFDGTKWHMEGPREGLPGTEIRALTKIDSPSGPSLLVATEAGLARRENRQWKALKSPPPGDLRVLLGAASAAGAERAWATTGEGLFRWRGGKWEAVEREQGTPMDVLSLAESSDSQGAPTLWIGTRGHGLWELRGDQWKRYDPMPRFPKNWITSLRIGKGPSGRQRLWVGTRGQGLAAMDLNPTSHEWKVYDARGKVALPNTVILSIEEDSWGRLYLGASGGIERLSFAADGSTLDRVETFSTADGLLSSIANPGASLLDRQGRIWFGLPEGTAFLDPSAPPLPRVLPSPVLEKLTVEGQEVPTLPGAQFGHQMRRLSFEFFVPAFFREEDLRYRTQLIGQETEPGPWRYENLRDFSGLKAGRYELQVWARNHESQVSAPLRFPFEIKAPPWRHPVALAFYLVLAGGLLLGYINLRTRILLRRNLWLQAKVEEATVELRENHRSLMAISDHLYRLNEEKSVFMGMAAHDLRNPLNGILLKAELLALSEDGKSQLVARDICTAVDGIVTMLNRLLDLEAIESGSRPLQLENLEAGMVLREGLHRQEARAREKGIEILNQIPHEPVWVRADLSTLNEIVENLLTNALKFSHPKSRVWVGCEVQGSQGCLWVRDEGPGFRPEDREKAFKRFSKLSARPTGGETSTGLGLAIVKRLVEDMGGEVGLESEWGVGTTFRIRLPLAKGSGSADI